MLDVRGLEEEIPPHNVSLIFFLFPLSPQEEFTSFTPRSSWEEKALSDDEDYSGCFC